VAVSALVKHTGAICEDVRSPQPAEPIDGLSLVASVLWSRVRRDPAPVALIAGLALALLVLRRGRR
jgi:hypothetical protein